MGSSILVLISTLGTDEEILNRLFQLGTRGYLHKNCNTGLLKEALQEIFQKGLYLKNPRSSNSLRRIFYSARSKRNNSMHAH
jgi:DNA-binding NarL/FixJ family response regulator